MGRVADSIQHSTGGFTDHLWRGTAPIRLAIDQLDFLRQLGDGTLPQGVFRSYIEQDSLYMIGEAKALGLLAVHCPDPTAAAFWAHISSIVASTAASLHEELLDEPLRLDSTQPSTTCLAYVSYLVATAATQPYAVAAAAVLPCRWIYSEVSADLAVRAQAVLAADPAHPYARWVARYRDAEYLEEVHQARVFVDSAAAATTEAERSAMSTAFATATRYELMFWQTALHPQLWPA